jgi:hypothetical protein
LTAAQKWADSGPACGAFTVVTVYGFLGHVVLLVIHQLAFSVQTTAAIQAELAFAKVANLAGQTRSSGLAGLNQLGAAGTGLDLDCGA